MDDKSIPINDLITQMLSSVDLENVSDDVVKSQMEQLEKFSGNQQELNDLVTELEKSYEELLSKQVDLIKEKMKQYDLSDSEVIASTQKMMNEMSSTIEKAAKHIAKNIETIGPNTVGDISSIVEKINKDMSTVHTKILTQIKPMDVLSQQKYLLNYLAIEIKS